MRTPKDIYNGTLPEIPEHVPANLVYDFDFIRAKVDDPIDFWRDLDRQGMPEIFYSLHNGGHWTMRKLEDIKYIYREWQTFHNFPTGLPVEPDRPAVIPTEIDPPYHKKYRAVLAPLFTPARIKELSGMVRETAVNLIEPVVEQGHCDFVKDISGKMPTSLFLQLMGMPLEKFDDFMRWEEDLLRGTPDKSKVAAQSIESYLAGFLEEQAKNPGDNVTGAILKARDEHGKPWSDEELMSVGFMLFTAGLDTVTNTMGLIWHFLAENPQARTYIRENLDDPIKMSSVFDELMRTHTIVTNTRRVRADTEYKGLTFKKGDVIVLSMTMANYDPMVVDNPEVIDLTRDVNPHVAFGMGHHRCLGSMLAKGEIEICLREWLTRIPDFSIAPDAKINTWVRVLAGMDSLPLVW